MPRSLVTAFVVFAGFATLAANPVKADSIDQFTYQSGGNTFTWSLQSSPSIGSGFVSGFLFTIPNVLVSENGAPAAPSRLDFFSTAAGGGFDLFFVFPSADVDAFGPQVYSGNEASPTFLLGTFAFTDFATSTGGVPGTLTISAAPEPSSVLMLLTGALWLVLVGCGKKSPALRLQR